MLLTQGCYAEMSTDDGAAAANVSDSLREDPRDAEIPTDARGIWVWGTTKRLEDPRAAEIILETCRESRLNEVYLSVGNGAMKLVVQLVELVDEAHRLQPDHAR